MKPPFNPLDEPQPDDYGFGNRTYIVADVEPLDVDGVRTMAVGTVMWAIGFVALLPFLGQLRESGRGWWMWTCLAGFGLGVLGWDFCRRRRGTRLGKGEAGQGHREAR